MGEAAPERVYRELRLMALHRDVDGVVVDIPMSSAYASLAVFADAASLYTSGGGGILGAGDHANVAAMAQQLLTVVQEHRDEFTTVDDETLPPPGSVRFHLVGPRGTRRRDIPEDAFWGRIGHPMMPVVTATQALISELQKVQPSGDS